jgi:hypothetical protein
MGLKLELVSYAHVNAPTVVNVPVYFDRYNNSYDFEAEAYLSNAIGLLIRDAMHGQGIFGDDSYSPEEVADVVQKMLADHFKETSN